MKTDLYRMLAVLLHKCKSIPEHWDLFVRKHFLTFVPY